MYALHSSDGFMGKKETKITLSRVELEAMVDLDVPSALYFVS